MKTRPEHTCVLLVWSQPFPNYPLTILFTAQIMNHYGCKAPHSDLTTFDSSKAQPANLANKQTTVIRLLKTKMLDFSMLPHGGL